MLLDLYKSGVFNGTDGKLRAETKAKLLSLLGYADMDGESSLLKLHEEKTKNENIALLDKDVSSEVYDEHNLHIDEHTRYVLSEDEYLTPQQKARFAKHIVSHRKLLKEN